MQKKNNIASSIRRSLSVVCCLLPFLVGQFQQMVRHQLEHSHFHAEHHSPEREADACHQSIFHAGVAQACDHPTHITPYEQECELCDSILLPLHFALRELTVPPLDLPGEYDFYYLPERGWSLAQSPTARGPPLLG